MDASVVLILTLTEESGSRSNSPRAAPSQVVGSSHVGTKISAW